MRDLNEYRRRTLGWINGQRLWSVILTLTALVAPSGRLLAQTPEERGLAIAREADRRARGYHDYAASLTMRLRDAGGHERRREMRIRVLGDGDHSEGTLIVFNAPRDLQGIALLSFANPRGADDQWLYLPAFKRVKRIASSNRSDPFMGSEFAYEDIGSQEVEKFTYRFLREELMDDHEVFVVERRPVDSGSGYSRQVVRLDNQEYRPLRIDYYDREDSLLKTLSFDDYTRYGHHYWRAGAMTMLNHRTGASTTLLWQDYEFDSGLDERDFDPDRLARER